MNRVQNSAFAKAAKAWKRRAMRGANTTVQTKEYQREISSLRKAIAEAFTKEGQLTISEQRRHYTDTKRGYYGMDYPLLNQDPRAINLQEIINPGVISGGHVGLLGGMYLTRKPGENYDSIKVSSRAKMKPYAEELPKLSAMHYLKEGWKSTKSKRSMAPRDVVGYLIENINLELLKPVFTENEIDRLFRLPESIKNGRETIVTTFKDS
jgi:hypothetical protein